MIARVLAAAGSLALALAVPAAAARTPSPEERGRDLYGASCATCHGQAGEGSDRGPSLRGAGAAGADYQLSTGRMPIPRPDVRPERQPPAFTEADIAALTAYVASLGTGPVIPRVRPGDVRQGRELYLATCASCHSGSQAGGTLAHGLAAPPLLYSTPTQIAEAVRLGPGAMPAFPASVLSDAQLDAIASYLTTTRPQLDHGGAPLGGIGPVAEGAVALLAGLGLLLLFIRLIGKRAP
ncbi:c-type cytochrome [Nonomuraea sp. NPDC049504]|uniref:cytochrome bc1 complex diheme cytochrome c subunit n=1 Tax=Nonomuraea sp. NPDC049504 TaxID=3154729 RepID=UPI0034264C38